MKTINPSIRFEFTSRAQELIAKQGIKEITVNPVDINSCCIPVVAPPDVHKGKPKDLDQYDCFEHDGLYIFYNRTLTHPPEVTFDTQGFSFMKGLKITDWEINFN